MSTNVATFLFAAHSFPYRNCSSARERAPCAYIPAGLFINTHIHSAINVLANGKFPFAFFNYSRLFAIKASSLCKWN